MSDENEEALSCAYKHLSRRDHTVAQLRERLERAQLGEAAIDYALGVVREHGYVDDGDFARRFAEDRRNLDGWGPERIRARLKAAGVEGETIEGVLSTRNREEEIAAACALLAVRIGGAPRDGRERQKAYAMLVRRGYESELAYDAVRRFEGATAG